MRPTRTALLVFLCWWGLAFATRLVAAEPSAPEPPAASARSIMQDIQKQWQPGKVTRVADNLTAASISLTAPSSWTRDIIPDVNLSALSGYYYRYVGIPLMICLLAFTAYGRAMAGQFDPYDLLKRFLVVAGFMAGATPLFQAMTTVQQGFPKIMGGLALSALSNQTDDVSVVAEIRQSVERAINNVTVHVMTHAAHTAPAQSYRGPTGADGQPNVISFPVRPYVDYMIIPLQKCVDAIEVPEGSNMVKQTLPTGVDRTDPESVSWFDSPPTEKLRDFNSRLSFYLRYDPEISSAIAQKIADTFYDNGSLFRRNSTTSTTLNREDIDETTFRTFESAVYDKVLESMTKVTALSPLGNKFIVEKVSGACNVGERGTGVVGLFHSSSELNSWFSGGTDDSQLHLFVCTSAAAANRVLGKQPPVESPSLVTRWVMKTVAVVNSVLSMLILNIFTFGFNLMLRIQFFFMILAVPFYMSDKTEKAFIGAFKNCITLVLTPLVGLMMLTLWNLAFASILGGMLGTAAGGVASLGLLFAFGIGQMATLMVLNICMMLYICFLAPKFTKYFLSGHSVGAAAVGGLIAAAGVAAGVGAAAASAGPGAAMLSRLGGGGRLSTPTADDSVSARAAGGSASGGGSAGGGSSGPGGGMAGGAGGGPSKVPTTDTGNSVAGKGGTLGAALKEQAGNAVGVAAVADSTEPKGATGPVATGSKANGAAALAASGPKKGSPATFVPGTGSFSAAAAGAAPSAGAAAGASAQVAAASPASGSPAATSGRAMTAAPVAQGAGSSAGPAAVASAGGAAVPPASAGTSGPPSLGGSQGPSSRGSFLVGAGRAAQLAFGIPPTWEGKKGMAGATLSAVGSSLPKMLSGPQYQRHPPQGMKALGNREAAGRAFNQGDFDAP